VCAVARRKCSLVEVSKAPKSSPSKGNSSIDPQIVDDSPPSSKKNKKTSVINAIASKFSSKRKTADRSPEAPPAPSKKASIRSFTPSLSSSLRPSEASGPAASHTPSLFSGSVHSFDSGTGRNYDAERLRLLLNASTEDLALERSRAAQREQLLVEEFASRSRAYEARIRELENANKGEGSSRRR
jgi:hypothetical protein